MLPKVTKKKTQKSKKRTQKSTGTWSRALKRKFWRFCVCVECICVRVAAGIATDLSSHRAADDERRRDAPRSERLARRKPKFSRQKEIFAELFPSSWIFDSFRNCVSWKIFWVCFSDNWELLSGLCQQFFVGFCEWMYRCSREWLLLNIVGFWSWFQVSFTCFNYLVPIRNRRKIVISDLI